MNDLIEKNMGLVLMVVNRFNPQNQTEKEAYIQAGRIGLWKALMKFSHKRGCKFSPYAWNPIKWEIIKEIRSTNKITHLPLWKEDCIGTGTSVENTNSLISTLNTPFWEWVPTSLNKMEAKVIQLRLEGHNFKEISNISHKHRTSIKKIFQLAIDKIQHSNNE